MDKLPIFLFFVGLILEAVGFLLGAAEHIPLVVRVTSPDYVAASQGIRILQSGEVLDESSVGFMQITRIFLDRARAQNPPEILRQIQVQEVRLAGSSGIAFGRSGVRETVPVTVTLSNGQEISWELPEIKAEVDALKAHSLFLRGIGLFVAGLICQIVGFAVDWDGSKTS